MPVPVGLRAGADGKVPPPRAVSDGAATTRSGLHQPRAHVSICRCQPAVRESYGALCRDCVGRGRTLGPASGLQSRRGIVLGISALCARFASRSLCRQRAGWDMRSGSLGVSDRLDSRITVRVLRQRSAPRVHVHAERVVVRERRRHRRRSPRRRSVSRRLLRRRRWSWWRLHCGHLSLQCGLREEPCDGPMCSGAGVRHSTSHRVDAAHVPCRRRRAADACCVSVPNGLLPDSRLRLRAAVSVG